MVIHLVELIDIILFNLILFERNLQANVRAVAGTTVIVDVEVGTSE